MLTFLAELPESMPCDMRLGGGGVDKPFAGMSGLQHHIFQKPAKVVSSGDENKLEHVSFEFR